MPIPDDYWLRRECEELVIDGGFELPVGGIDRIIALCRKHQVVGLLEAAYISDNFSKGYEISWWHEQTKNNIARVLCRDVAEKIREKANALDYNQLNQNGGTR